MGRLSELAKYLAFRSPILGRWVAPGYPYKINPVQLGWLTEAIEKSRSNPTPGCIVEAGVATGMTSFWLAHHLQLQYDKRLYVAIDTFKGFTKVDIDHEIHSRGKAPELFQGFGYNDPRIFERNIRRTGYQHCAVFTCPIQDFQWEALPRVDVLLLDVDLYIPTRVALNKVIGRMNDWSFIMIDDCWPTTMTDGCLQAYLEFCQAYQVEPATAGLNGGLLELKQGKPVRPESAFVTHHSPRFDRI